MGCGFNMKLIVVIDAGLQEDVGCGFNMRLIVVCRAGVTGRCGVWF